MASITDLQGMFWNDEENLQSALGLWLLNGDVREAKEPPKLPAVVYARWKRDGATSDEEMARVVLTVLPEQASSIVNELEAQLAAKLGVNPSGILRVRANGSGHAAKPGLDMQRTLRPGNSSTADPNVALLRQMLDAVLMQNRELSAQRSEEHKALMALVGKQGEDLSKFATMGAANAAIGANSTVGSILGVVVLFAIAPFIRGLVGGGVDPQLAIAWRGKLMAWLGMAPPSSTPGSTPSPTPRPVRLPASTVPPAKRLKADVADVVDFDIDAVISRAQADPAFAEQIARRAINEPGILETLNIPPDYIAQARVMFNQPVAA